MESLRLSSIKEEMMENELQIDLFTHMQEVEVGRTLNSRFHYLRENIESAFSNLWKKFLHGPKRYSHNSYF